MYRTVRLAGGGDKKVSRECRRVRHWKERSLEKARRWREGSMQPVDTKQRMVSAKETGKKKLRHM